MEGLSGTEGKGVMMFARRRQRLEEMALEQEEELRNRAPPPEEPEPPARRRQTEETYLKSAPPAPQQAYADTARPQLAPQQQENIKPVTHDQIPEPKPLVPNRTAKPFGFINSREAAVPSRVNAPVAKKHELKFKVPVPVNTSPQVWSPTGDIIASRDERISVPAKNAGNLPGSNRRVVGKQVPSDQQLQNRGDRKSYIEPEEDFFSLGAEACNFMQPLSVKLKVPPPVAPKPAVNQDRQPWLSAPPPEPYNPPRSPVSPSVFANAAGPQGQSYAPNSAPFLTPANAWAPARPSAQHQPRANRNSWSGQPTQPAASVKAVSPAASPAYQVSSSSWNKPDNVANSSASCPPQQRQPPKAAGPTAKAPAKPDGQPMMGKGAELFARRQSRMEKFVVDGETVQANRARSTSPAPSLPNSWRYSSNVRAPPPLSYNPILAPFYPPAATKQPRSTSPNIKSKAKNKDKPKPKKHLSSLEVMQHQPYQLDSSLFKYEAVSETQSHSPTPSPAPEIAPMPRPRKPRSAPSHALRNRSAAAGQMNPDAPNTTCPPSGTVSSPNPNPKPQPTSSAEPRLPVKQPDAKPAVTSTATSAVPRHKAHKPAPSSQSPSCQSPSTANQQADVASCLALFSPASLIARGARQMAPKPTFSAKKPGMAANKQWRPIAVQL